MEMIDQRAAIVVIAIVAILLLATGCIVGSFPWRGAGRPRRFEQRRWSQSGPTTGGAPRRRLGWNHC